MFARKLRIDSSRPAGRGAARLRLSISRSLRVVLYFSNIKNHDWPFRRSHEEIGISDLIRLDKRIFSDRRQQVNDRVVRAAIVLKEIVKISDKGIPQDLLTKATCVAVIPGMKKGGFIFGGNYGRGLMSCRTEQRGWPLERAVHVVSSGRKFRASNRGSIRRSDPCHFESFRTGKHAQHQVHAGRGRLCSRRPGRQNGVGRNRRFDVRGDSGLLPYARPVCRYDCQGGVIRPDKDANQILYGKKIEPGKSCSSRRRTSQKMPRYSWMS